MPIAFWGKAYTVHTRLSCWNGAIHIHIHVHIHTNRCVALLLQGYGCTCLLMSLFKFTAGRRGTLSVAVSTSVVSDHWLQNALPVL